MVIQKLARTVLIGVLPLTWGAAANSAPVRYQLTDVVTAVGQYPTGVYGTGSLLGYFVYDQAKPLGVTEFIITAVADNAVQFEWSSFPGFPFHSSVVSYFDTTTGVQDLRFSTALGDRHGVTLELAFRPSDFDFSTGTIPLIPAIANLDQTSNWYEIQNSEYGAYGNVRTGSLAVAVPEPMSFPLVAVGLLALLGVRKKSVQAIAVPRPTA